MDGETNEPLATETLTWKQRLFVEAYLGETNGNATEAARIAGYACPGEQAYENLRKPQIQAAIAARLNEASLKTNEILARLSDQATADLADFVEVTDTGIRLDLKKAAERGKLHLIKKLTPNKYGTAIELHDAQAALVHLGRYRKLFVDRLEHEFSDKSDEELRALAAAEGLVGRDDPPGPDAD